LARDVDCNINVWKLLRPNAPILKMTNESKTSMSVEPFEFRFLMMCLYI